MHISRILLCVFLFGILCGCFDYNELNMQELVNGAAIDSSGDKMEVNVICAPIAEAEETTGKVYCGVGDNFFDAVRSISTKASKKLYWGHARTLLIGEVEARRGIGDVLNTISRARDIYPDIVPVVVKQKKAKELLGSEIDEDISEYLFDIFANEANSRRFKGYELWEIIGKNEVSGVYILPVTETDGKEISLSGGAVMKENRLCGYLSGEQMLLLSLLTQSAPGGYLPAVYKDDAHPISFEILANDVRSTFSDNTYLIKQKCVLSPGDVSSDLSEKEMKNLAEQFLKNEYAELIDYVKRNDFGDVFGISKEINQHADINKIDFEIQTDVRISNVFGGK